MIKHLLLPTTVALVLVAGCSIEWWPPCSATVKTNCIEQAPVNGECAAGTQPYYVWYLEGACVPTLSAVCASDVTSAQGQAQALLGNYIHGDVSTNEDATRPETHYFCPSGDSCYLGSSDGSLVTSFAVFGDDQEQIAYCESMFDANGDCSWPEVPTKSCPASP